MSWYEKDKYKECCHNDDCESFDTCRECWDEWAERNPPMTNADHIRAMSDEELANFIVFHTSYNDGSGFTYYNFLTGEDDIRDKAEKDTLDWLKQPYKEKEE